MRRAGSREIGGVIVGEFIGDDTFRIADISIQRDGGTAVHFVRDPSQAKAFLDEFFSKTGNDFERFNYLGEWHSHPSFPPAPSTEDYETAQEIVESDEVGANFIVLMICRRRFWGRFEASLTLFQKQRPPEPAQVQLDIVRRFI